MTGFILQYLCVASVSVWVAMQKKVCVEGFCPAGLYYDVVYILSLQVHLEQAATCSLHTLAEQKTVMNGFRLHRFGFVCNTDWG